MATLRSHDVPVGGFNFTVTATAMSDQPFAGFQEVSGLGMEVTETEYRAGNEETNSVPKVGGLTKTTDVTLKRGVVQSNDLWQWITNSREGALDQAGMTLTLKLMDEARTGPVMTWTLHSAKPKSYEGVTLNAKGGTDVAIEELVLSVEAIELRR
jgi:phage tail-like protein